MEKEVATKVAAAQPTHVPQKQGGAQYIRYTPSQQGLAFNSGAKQRVIRMVEAQKDPMEPPRFKYGRQSLHIMNRIINLVVKVFCLLYLHQFVLMLA